MYCFNNLMNVETFVFIKTCVTLTYPFKLETLKKYILSLALANSSELDKT